MAATMQPIVYQMSRVHSLTSADAPRRTPLRTPVPSVVRLPPAFSAVAGAPQRPRPRSRLVPPSSSSSSTPSSSTSAPAPLTARQTALAYYSAYNRRDIPAVMQLIHPSCVYEDLIYQDPFVGREAIAAYFAKIAELVPDDVQFVVEDITGGDAEGEDATRVGVRWHVELEGGIVLPFSRGVSFYRTAPDGRIIFARDIVEPAAKPGAAALQGIAVVAPLVRRLGPAADPSILKTLPIATGAMLVFYATYLYTVLLSPSCPGPPATATPPGAIESILHESYNFFYVNIALASFGINPVPNIAEHPVAEAQFNFINAWSFMMLPVWRADPKGGEVERRGWLLPLYFGTLFLTNVFMPLYLAVRLLPPPSKQNPNEQKEPPTTPTPSLPWYAPAFGSVAAAVGLVSLWWAVAARPELGGDLAARLAYFDHAVHSDRIFWAFCVDAGLYAVWQAWLLGDAGATAGQRWVPFFGMAHYLIFGGETKKQ